MSALNMTHATSYKRLPPFAMAAAVTLFAAAAHAAAPGITGGTGTTAAFNLTAQPAYLNQPDGQAVYSWGYGCDGAQPQPAFAPAAGTGGPANASITGATCPTMQVPGPTLIVTEGQTVTVKLTNNLPTSAGNTSILFPGFNVTASCPTTQGLLTCEAAPGSTMTYTFIANSPGTRAYYSGTQGDLQIEMGLYGAIIVLPATIPSACTSGVHAVNSQAQANWGESDFRLAAAAYNHPQACYDREYLFQFSEMDANIHAQALAQVTATNGCQAGAAGCSLNVPTEPYHPTYFMINGRSMPDDMDPNYSKLYPHQPYNGNPHMHPGELTLVRIIGQGRWQHPFHEHGNHVRILGRDANLILSQTDPNSLAGPLLFTTTTTPGLAMDGIFYWTGKGLNWDAYGHNPASKDVSAKLPCTPDANGYNTVGTDSLAYQRINYFEWCQDHNKPLQVAPFGDVAGGGPATLPDPNLFTNGAWYGGSPYLGPNATLRATGCSAGAPAGSCGATGSTPPSGTIANSPSTEAGFAFMWHSHNEREITTNNIFPGGMLMMMLVDSREFVIDESN
jgi:FtsP/CotA-like multicopper oxidase with cupredoxin domain